VSPETLVALASEGLRVVRVITAQPTPKALMELRSAGVTVEVLLAAPS
jgi:hypothetical protein